MSNFWQLHQKDIATLTAAEQKVATWLQKHQDQALAISIKSLSTQAKVSEPTVIRFCRKLGLDGFSALKIALAQQWSGHKESSQTVESFHYGNTQLRRGDTSEILIDKILNNAIADISWLKEQSTASSIDQAVQMIEQASKIECFGLGGSAIAAEDAVFKLNRLGYNAGFTLSLHDYARAFSSWRKGRLLFLFSRNSQGKIIDLIAEAQKYDIPVVLVGPMNASLLVNNSHQLTLVETKVDFEYQPKNAVSTEENLILSPIKSRLMQILIVDMIVSILGLKGQ